MEERDMFVAKLLKPSGIRVIGTMCRGQERLSFLFQLGAVLCIHVEAQHSVVRISYFHLNNLEMYKCMYVYAAVCGDGNGLLSEISA